MPWVSFCELVFASEFKNMAKLPYLWLVSLVTPRVQSNATAVVHVINNSSLPVAPTAEGHHDAAAAAPAPRACG